VSDLPMGWTQASLEEIADVMDYEREPINSSERESRIAGKSESDLFPYFGATGQVGLIDSFRSEGERVLLGEDAAPFLDPTKDKAYLATGRFWVNNHAHVLRGAGGLVDNRFLCHQLNVVDYHSFVTGSTRLKLTSAAMRRIPLVLAPAREQVRIVAKLEELLSDLDAGLAELKSAQKKLQQYRQSLLKAAVEGALTADWREAQRQQGTVTETGAQLLARILTERRARWEARQLAKFKEQGKAPPKDWQKKYIEPVQPDATDLQTLPEGWVWATIDQLTLEQRYGSSAKTTEDDSGVPVLRMGNIQDGRLDYTNLKFLPKSHDEFPELFLEEGDLLFNRTNSPELVGKTAVYRSERIPCSYASYLIAVRLTQHYASEIAATYINSAYGRQWIKSVVVQQVGQANVNGSKLAALAVPLPPMAERAELLRTLSAQIGGVVAQEKGIDRSLKFSATQRHNVLRAAFTGQLVPQDPKEETANVLLERIRAERLERSKQPKVRRAKQEKEITTVLKMLIDVLAEAGDWLPAQEAFRRCGVTDGALTERIEELYSELRKLDKAGRLQVQAVTDAQGRKLYDKIKLRAG
jgi:type I restriction enzyme, S subunit